jgi:hypothetical protein
MTASDRSALHGGEVAAEVELRLYEDVLAVHWGKVGWVDDDGAVHAVAEAQQHRHGRAVVHPDPGPGGGEPVGEALARFDRPHRLVRGECSGVEVDAVIDGAVVGEGDLEGVADFAA